MESDLLEQPVKNYLTTKSIRKSSEQHNMTICACWHLSQQNTCASFYNNNNYYCHMIVPIIWYRSCRSRHDGLLNVRLTIEEIVELSPLWFNSYRSRSGRAECVEGRGTPHHSRLVALESVVTSLPVTGYDTSCPITSRLPPSRAQLWSAAAAATSLTANTCRLGWWSVGHIARLSSGLVVRGSHCRLSPGLVAHGSHCRPVAWAGDAWVTLRCRRGWWRVGHFAAGAGGAWVTLPPIAGLVAHGLRTLIKDYTVITTGIINNLSLRKCYVVSSHIVHIQQCDLLMHK